MIIAVEERERVKWKMYAIEVTLKDGTVTRPYHAKHHWDALTLRDKAIRENDYEYVDILVYVNGKWGMVDRTDREWRDKQDALVEEIRRNNELRSANSRKG